MLTFILEMHPAYADRLDIRQWRNQIKAPEGKRCLWAFRQGSTVTVSVLHNPRNPCFKKKKDKMK